MLLNYRDDPVVENSMPEHDKLKAVLSKALPLDTRWTPRVRVNAVAGKW